jgi:undecaprenyl pyrophosphate synthase
MQKTSTYIRTEKITRYTISTPLISHINSSDQHVVFITLGNGRSIKIPKNGSYRVHTSGVLEVNLDATTTYYAQGEWLKIKDTNQSKMLKHFQDAATVQPADIISLS